MYNNSNSSNNNITITSTRCRKYRTPGTSNLSSRISSLRCPSISCLYMSYNRIPRISSCPIPKPPPRNNVLVLGVLKPSLKSYPLVRRASQTSPPTNQRLSSRSVKSHNVSS